MGDTGERAAAESRRRAIADTRVCGGQRAVPARRDHPARHGGDPGQRGDRPAERRCLLSGDAGRHPRGALDHRPGDLHLPLGQGLPCVRPGPGRTRRRRCPGACPCRLDRLACQHRRCPTVARCRRRLCLLPPARRAWPWTAERAHPSQTADRRWRHRLYRRHGHRRRLARQCHAAVSEARHDVPRGRAVGAPDAGGVRQPLGAGARSCPGRVRLLAGVAHLPADGGTDLLQSARAAPTRTPG